MKKIIALLMTIALMISALALPAFAEGATETVDQVTTATRVTAQGGPNGQQPPMMPGNGQNDQNGQGGQPPMMPGNGQNDQGGPNGQQPPMMPGNGQNDQNGQGGQQPPEMPGNGQNDQNNQNGQQPPEMNGSEQSSQNGQEGQNGQQSGNKPGNGKNGKPQGKPGQKDRAAQNAPGGEPEKQLDFEQLVKDNVITQEICDAILSYMKEHAPQGQPDGTAPAEGSEAPNQTEGNAPAQGSEPPAKPEGDQNAPGGMEAQLLQELLDNSVITQEIYDLLLEMLTTTDTTAGTAAADA